jgi:N-acetylglucosaminyl-diphospho-decaprenol L-rhamnosyltransferase
VTGPRSPGPDGEAPRRSLAIVVVTYNSDAVIEQCIAALDRSIEAARRRLSGPPALVLVDNRSTIRPQVRDATTRITHRVPLEHNVGFAPAVNEGLARVPAPERVLLVNPDTRMEPTALERLLAAMEARAAALVGPILVGADGCPQAQSERPFHSPAREAVRQFAPFLSSRRPFGRQAERTGVARALSGACLLIDGRFLRDAGGLDTSLAMYLEDVELCARAHDAGRLVLLARDARCMHALGGSSGDENFRASTGLHLMLLAARLEFIRRHQGVAAMRLARSFMFVGAAVRVAVALLLREPALLRKHRAAMTWALRSGRPPHWPLSG